MTRSLTGKCYSRMEFDYQDSVDVGNRQYAQYDDYVEFVKTMTSGTGTDQYNRLWVDRRVLSLASGTDLLDLAGGLTDKWGNTLTFKGIKEIMIVNEGIVDGVIDTTATVTAGEDLKVGGAGAAGQAWGAPFDGNQDAEMVVRSGGMLHMFSPMDVWSVSPGTQDILKIAHAGSAASGGDISYLIGIAGIE